MDSCTDRCAGSARPVDGSATTVESSDRTSEPYREYRTQSFLSRRQRRSDTSDGSGPECRDVLGISLSTTERRDSSPAFSPRRSNRPSAHRKRAHAMHRVLQSNRGALGFLSCRPDSRSERQRHPPRIAASDSRIACGHATTFAYPQPASVDSDPLWEGPARRSRRRSTDTHLKCHSPFSYIIAA